MHRASEIQNAAGWLRFVAMACGLVVSVAPACGGSRLSWYASSEARVSDAPDGSFWRESGDATMTDIDALVRPMFAAETGDWKLAVEVDATSTVGDTRERLLAAGLSGNGLAGAGCADLVDLDRVWSDGARHRTATRVDRLALAWTQPWGTVTAGRHVVTWGGGLFFNPFDLFNPFAPSDVVRDYKTGADMLHVDLPFVDGGLQMLAVGRRSALDGHASADTSSFAMQGKLTRGALEWSGLAAWHYDEPALGLGLSGQVGEAAWHTEATWVRVRPAGMADTRDHVSAVANIQYSWIWHGRNVLGSLEYAYNSFERSDHAAAMTDPFVAAQLARGTLFTLGRHYVAGSLQIEVHPLLNVYLGGLLNVGDPSGLLQPRAVWNASDAVQVTFGVDLPFGGSGSEYGGFSVPGLEGEWRTRPAAYVRIAAWF